MISTMVRDDASVISLEGATEESARDVATYLGNDNLFPHERPRTVVFVGNVPAPVRAAVERGVRRRGFAVESMDPVAAMAARGPASVVWYDSPQTMPLAAFWAHRAETVHGCRYVVLGREEDYLALEARGAVVPSVLDFGGKFPVAAGRAGWLVDGEGSDGAAPVAGVDAPGSEELPAWPWLSSKEAAADVLRLLGELPEDLLRSPASRGELTERLRQARDHMASGRFGEADAGLGSLRQALAAEVVNAGTLVDLRDQVDLLRKAVAQEVGNRPPEAVATPDHLYQVPWGMEARVQLTASMSRDADSTPGTTNNIRSYRWLDERGWVLGTEPEVVVKLTHGMTGLTEHAITLEVVDAYGAMSRTISRVTIVGVRPPR